MTKNQKRLDTNQLSLFDLIRTFSEQKPASKPAGSFDIDRQLRAAISQALKQCPLSIYEVAAKMSVLCGTEITGSMLYSWTAESKNQHRFPAIYLPAFCEVTGCSEPLKLLGNLMGVFIMPGPDALRVDIQKRQENINKEQAELRKCLIFLKEMEAAR